MTVPSLTLYTRIGIVFWLDSLRYDVDCALSKIHRPRTDQRRIFFEQK